MNAIEALMKKSTHCNTVKQYPTLGFHKEVSTLCYPFLKKFNYCILNFIRLYNNGKIFYLCDNHDWLSYYLVNKYPSVGAFEQNSVFRHNKYVLWDALNDKDPIVIYSRKLFNIRYGITLVRPFKDGHDFFNFGTSDNSLSVLNNIINQLDKLDQFAEEFYDKASCLITAAEKSSIHLNTFESTLVPHNKLKKIYLGPLYNYHHLTEKELAYLKNLVDGMTMPEIANLWEVSPRTIEKHIEHVKRKLGCQTQCELGYLVAKLGIITNL